MTSKELPIDDNNKSAERERSIQDDDEMMRILKEADEASAPVLEFINGPITVPLTEVEFIPSDIQDPKRQHELCYDHILKPLNKYLKGVPKNASDIIRKEVRLFLNEGATKGRDMRQTYFYLYEQAITVIDAWIRQYGGQNLQALFIAFRELNQQREARQQAADQESIGEG